MYLLGFCVSLCCSHLKETPHGVESVCTQVSLHPNLDLIVSFYSILFYLLSLSYFKVLIKQLIWHVLIFVGGLN